ncbi:triacylglycerol lipase OBL1-like [Rhododendron vialii]|uniref:triacylglycerol lipase OBL1-like n=1 Tax=Rhododendron vialii TaxID=182163 RepID=UPI0026602EE6|nr:triacylglycerol lipase OBL1-like [Rhododendron vialii]
MENYLELKPHDATLLDLVRIMFTSDNSLAMKKSVETSELNHLRGLELRWIIFISLYVQKLLLYLKKPMAWLGYVIEMCLNLPSSNGGFWWLLLNILKGSVVKPDRSSVGVYTVRIAKFVSVLGCIIGTRVELDKNIETTDNRYGAALSIMASKLAYEHQAFGQSVIIDHWKMEVLGWFNFWNGKQHISHHLM